MTLIYTKIVFFFLGTIKFNLSNLNLSDFLAAAALYTMTSKISQKNGKINSLISFDFPSMEKKLTLVPRILPGNYEEFKQSKS